jgi:hypothetical protein
MSKYEQGAKAEFVVAEMLKSDGWYIANASSLDEIAGDDGAPLVRGEDDKKITPDILAMRDGRTVWVEVKLKTTGAEYIRKNEQYEHFIDLKNWHSYLQVESSSGCEVWLAVVEQPEQTLRRQMIEDIDVVGHWDETQVKNNNGEKYGETGVFVPQSDFLGTHIPAELAGEICEQRQLTGGVDTTGEVLPDVSQSEPNKTDSGQFSLGDYATDGGDDTEDNND